MTRRASVPLAATFSLLAGCVDGPVLLDDTPDGGGASDVDAGGTGVIYSNPLSGTTYRWPNAEIPYRYEGDWTGDEQRVVITEMHTWERLTRIHFTRDDDCSSCLVITDQGSSCNTTVGTSGGGTMHLPDVDDCVAGGVVRHELGHAIGLRHEQQRTDRDNYVTFHPEHAADTADFAISNSSTEPVGAYEYTSVMGYRSFAHTGDGRMTLTRNDSWGLFDETKQMWRTGTTVPVSQLKVGDFDGNGVDDVVYLSANLGWVVSWEAKSEWQPLAAPVAPADQVRAGYVDGDTRADLVWADGTQWRYSSAGNGPWQPLFALPQQQSTMRIVDYDGDGDSDMVRIAANRFQVSIDGRTSWINVGGTFDTAMTLDQVVFGDFVGDARIDALREKPGTFDFGLEVSDGLSGTFTFFRAGVYPSMNGLRAIDMDGAGRVDLVRIGSNSDPGSISYEVALGGTGAWTEVSSDGVEDFGNLVIGNFNGARTGQEMLVNGYYPGRASEATHTDRGGVAHIYYPQILLSRDGRARWEYWADESVSANIGSYQVGDFDGDGKDDLFDVYTSWITGLTSTRYHRMDPDRVDHTDVGWKTLTANVGPEANIAIGQFYGDARVDTFRKNGSWWEIQDGGVGPWMPMMYDTDTAVSAMGFVDLDGNGWTDIITANGGWKVSWDGRTQFQPLAGGLGTSVSLLRFGDFTGDGRSDIVTSFSNAWWIWSLGSTGWTKLRDDSTDIRNYRFGYFNDDTKLDVFRVNPTNNLWWEYSSGATGAWTRNVPNASLASSSIPLASLAIGHFSGPGQHSDVIGYIPALADDNVNGW